MHPQKAHSPPPPPATTSPPGPAPITITSYSSFTAPPCREPPAQDGLARVSGAGPGGPEATSSNLFSRLLSRANSWRYTAIRPGVLLTCAAAGHVAQPHAGPLLDGSS